MCEMCTKLKPRRHFNLRPVSTGNKRHSDQGTAVYSKPCQTSKIELFAKIVNESR